MTDYGQTHTGPYTQAVLSDRITSASDTPLPLSFAADSDTGIYRPAANTIGIVTGGTEAVRFTSGGLFQIGANGNQANGTAGTVFSTSVAPASAQQTIQGWFRVNGSDGTARFIPYW